MSADSIPRIFPLFKSLQPHFHPPPPPLHAPTPPFPPPPPPPPLARPPSRPPLLMQLLDATRLAPSADLSRRTCHNSLPPMAFRHTAFPPARVRGRCLPFRSLHRHPRSP